MSKHNNPLMKQMADSIESAWKQEELPFPKGTLPLTLINHIRLCDLGEVRSRLEQLQESYPDQYLVVEKFLLSCQPKKK